VRDHGKCAEAVARLVAFIADFPQSPNDNHVFQYHDIVGTLEEACGKDLSQFRIAPDRVNSRANSKTSSHWQAPFVASTVVGHSYFCGQVRALMGYVKTALGETD
jgi:hypothetical protein